MKISVGNIERHQRLGQVPHDETVHPETLHGYSLSLGGTENHKTRALGIKTHGLRYLFGLIPILLQVVVLQALAQQTGQQKEQARAERCLNVQVLNPLSEPMEAATVTIGDREQVTNVSGVATFCDLGAAPHEVIVSAENFQLHEGSVQQSEGTVTIRLRLTIATEELVVVGSRAQPRSVTESAVPIDAIPAQDIVRQGDTDLSNQLRTVIPSYNVSAHPIADAATIVRPASLRNLAPEHTLVLVNGKRRHRSSVIAWQFGSAIGSHGPDISTIPSIALRRVEVLRDGASAQYGSDAIAGVMNFQLKDGSSGGSFELNSGTYSQEGGSSYTFSGNVGLPLGQSGFANLSLEYGNTNRTDVSVQRTDAAGLIAAGNNHVANPAQPWGSPDIDDDLKLFGNFGHLFENGLQLYGHTNYAGRKVTGNFFYRNPTDNALFGDGKQLLVGDLLQAGGRGSADCPTVPIVGSVPDPAALDRLNRNRNCFAFAQRFPGGFTPQFGGEVTDGSMVAGLRGFTTASFTWDVSMSYGTHQTDFLLRDTVNASLGPESPTQFDPGLYRQEELGLNFDVAYAATDRVNIAAGAEWRNERFEIGAGDPASYEIGPYVNQGFTSGSNGFPGFSQAWSGGWNRNSRALYGDLELRDLAAAWTVGAAVRVEHFDLFGATTNGKLSGRYRFAPAVALRGSMSTGFRAPTVGQQYAQNVQTTLDTDGNLVDRGTIQSNSAVAMLKGGQALRPETSVNYTVGMIVNTGAFTFTADYFYINVSDRLTLTRDFTLTADEIAQVERGNIQGAGTLTSFNFFTNDFSTRTRGIDLVSTWTPTALGGNTTFSAVYNYTGTKVKSETDLLGEGDIVALENYVPDTRWNASLKQRVGRVNILGRLNYYGSWIDYWDAKLLGRGKAAPVFDGRSIVDLEVSLELADRVTLALGGQNVFNTFSDQYESAFTDIGGAPITMRFFGMPYSPFTPWGFNGAYYYARLSYSFGTAFN